MKAIDLRSPLWAVTSFFNPAGRRSRVRNYRAFRSRLPIPLLAVELSFDGRFELQEGSDADIALRFSRGDVMWQKERLLNLAWRHLPAHCEEVAWIDADVVFPDPEWPSRVREKLQHHEVVHPFTHLRHLNREESARVGADAQVNHYLTHVSSFGAGAPTDSLSRVIARAEGAPSAGIAWAARRSWIERVGLYEGSVTGGGDSAFGAALLASPDQILRLHSLNPAQARYYLDWVSKVAGALRTPVGSVEGDVLHLWHGSLESRQTASRHARLAATGFDPAKDLVAEPDSPLRWRDPHGAAAQLLRSYFDSRDLDEA